ncbi:MAG: arsenic metallochaperone ArsD family protein [Zoogloeaceae bacterium]|uniref:arsenic metallochaperone ArsD family protein n=1 Tax=Denitromonas sp. TaxID=2734609 RepID=UPI001D6A10EC|nr:arsenic metallochaperone ArsD family protein [Rhodocyclaceae bacterium]MCP5222067.1 arsenic metallochaperone ArsD family protein [Zoogloeaceae bacterium]HPR06487.1 arsenic metallochaperone ArsD family protein [Denitromonas sp.]
MKSIQVFEPAQAADQPATDVAADLDWAAANGARIDRFNFAQQPLAFSGNATVKSFLDRSGPGALPLILLDGEIAMAGRYPSRGELTHWLGVTDAAPAEVSGCCSGGRCGG